MEFILTIQRIEDFAHEFWSRFSDNKVFAFTGEMGAGKTTIIGEICRAKGVKSATGSPTFSIINEYEFPGGIIYHLDLYRLNNEQEAMQAGVEEVLYSGEYCFVEWPEKAPRLIPQNALWIRVESIDFETRKLTIESSRISS